MPVIAASVAYLDRTIFRSSAHLFGKKDDITTPAPSPRFRLRALNQRVSRLVKQASQHIRSLPDVAGNDLGVEWNPQVRNVCVDPDAAPGGSKIMRMVCRV